MITRKTTKKLHLRFEHLYDAPIPIVVVLGEDLVIQHTNKKAELLFNAESDLRGVSLAKLAPELLDSLTANQILERCFKNGSTCELKGRVLNAKVGKRFDITFNPIHDEKEVIIGVMSYFTEIADAVSIGVNSFEPEKYLDNFFHHAPIGLVCYRGPEFIVDFANEKALEMWGKKLEEVKGKTIEEIFPEVESDPVIRARHQESLQRLYRGETHVVNEVELAFVRNGNVHNGWYSYIHEPYTDGNGNIIGMMAVAIEVTDQVEGRKKLQLITDALPSLISYINNRRQYDFVNHAYEVWFGHPREEVLGKSMMEVLGESAYEILKSRIDGVLTGKTESYEGWIDYKDGGKKYISASYIPHSNEYGQVLGFFVLVNDLTERKRQEEASQENEERLRLIVEGVQAGTFEYDLRTGTLRWSDELKVLMGLSKDTVVNQDTARAVVHPDDLHYVLEQSYPMLTSSQDYMSIDYRILRKDNKAIRWIHTRSKVIHADVGGERKPAMIIGFSIDITEEKAAEERLKEFNRNLEDEVQQRTTDLSELNKILLKRNEELRSTQSVLQQLIDSTIEYIAVIDRDLRILAVNKSFEDFVHRKRVDLIGKHISEIFAYPQGTHQIELMERVLKGERIHLPANPSISRQNVWFDTHFVPLTINEKVEGVIALSRDITAIMKSENELANVNKQLAEAQHLAMLGSWEWSFESGQVVWSDEMYRIYGYSEKVPIDFNKATERMLPEDAERSRNRSKVHVQQAIENFQRTGAQTYEVSSIEFNIQIPGGERKLLKSSGKIHLTPEGKPLRLVGAVQDITQLRATEEKLRNVIEQLEQKNHELESFNYVASHDLQEPLRKIQTFIDRIKSNTLKPDLVENYLSRIDTSAKRMAELIRSMLMLSRITKSDDDFKLIDLNQILEQCKNDFELRIRERDAKIQSDSLPVVWASEFQMGQLFGNLISNSLKFSNQNPTITVSCAKVEASDIPAEPAETSKFFWKLSFADNGIGFAPEYKDKIFGLFQRLHSKEEFTGTGIGLSIVKTIVNRHHGYIDATSEPGKGAKFDIWLPAK